MLAKLAIHLVPPTTDFRPPTTPLDIVANTELVVGAALIVAFTIYYGLRFRWYKTPPPEEKINFAGVAIFSMFFAMSMLLIFSLVTRVLTPGDYLFRDLYRVLVYFFLPAAGTFMFIGLFISRQQLLAELKAAERRPVVGLDVRDVDTDA